MELDRIDIKNLAIVLNKNTTMSRYSELIENKEDIIKALIMSNINTSDDFFEQYRNNSVILAANTMIEQSVLDMLALFLSFHRYRNRKIKEFTSIGIDNISILNNYGITTTKDLIDLCNTEKKRKLVADETKISAHVIKKAVCLADIARLPGIKDIRSSLYYDCGFISIKNIASQKPTEFIEKTSQFIEANNIDKKPPLFKEITTQIAWAKVYPDVIQL